MADQQNNQSNNSPKRDEKTLREISHLFLSSIREKQTGNSPRPQRTPPAKIEKIEEKIESGAIDFGAVVPETASNQLDAIAPVRAVIASHLNGHQRDRVREYAAHLCKTGERIGLIEIDAGEFRVTCFELGSSTQTEAPAVCDHLDIRRISESLEEMAWDIDRWLVLAPNPRLPEAQSLLRKINQWTVLATADSDGIVSCYRSLKGLFELHAHDSVSQSLSLAMLDTDDELDAARWFDKLKGVCAQFLHWPLENELPVLAAGSVVEHEVLVCRATKEKSSQHWQILSDFASRAKNAISTPKIERPAAPAKSVKEAAPPPRAGIELQIENEIQAEADDATDVIDLPAGDDSAAAIVSAAVHGDRTLVEAPIKPPMLANGSLAVTRERRLVLLAVAKDGLTDLRHIAEAWRWMNENRTLIAMAVPQLSIDPHQMPHLRLLINKSDISAEILQPLLQSANVTVHTYRKLKWGEKLGLLLEAA